MPTTDSPTSRLRLPHWGWILLATAILVVAYPALSIWVPHQREQQIVQKIEEWGGSFETENSGPEWLQPIVGDERMKVFDRVSAVDLGSAGKLDYNRIIDADLCELSGLTNLSYLNLGETHTTDAVLIHLSRLKNLDSLILHHTQVDDAGLGRLSGLTHLTHLDLGKTQVSDAGLVHLTGLKNLTYLYLGGTAVSDAGLNHLSEMKNLECLSLRATKVTDKGVESLKRTLPNCEISDQ